jgi:hypothetical protein
MNDLVPSPLLSDGFDLPAVQGSRALLPSREIVVNGRRCTVRVDHIDHAQLVKLAFPEAMDIVATSSMTISYRGGPNSARTGVLAPTERTLLANGEVFIVCRTDKS